MGKYDPRRSNGAFRNKLRARCASRGEPCALCGLPINYDLPSRVRVNGRWVYNDWAFELDEIIPVSKYYLAYSTPEACALDPGNHQPAHRICNRLKGNAMGEQARSRVRKALRGDLRPQNPNDRWTHDWLGDDALGGVSSPVA